MNYEFSNEYGIINSLVLQEVKAEWKYVSVDVDIYSYLWSSNIFDGVVETCIIKFIGT